MRHSFWVQNIKGTCEQNMTILDKDKMWFCTLTTMPHGNPSPLVPILFCQPKKKKKTGGRLECSDLPIQFSNIVFKYDLS